jgi:hypothetical protein
VDKLFSIIHDNATSNNVAIRILRDECELKNVFPSGCG